MKKNSLLFLGLVVFSFSSFCQKVGDKVKVEWKGIWFPSTILETKEGKFKVHYDGWDSKWDEWVEKGRIQVWKVGEKINVEWKGKWYPSTILEAKDGQFKVHYDGWEDTWDEWVTLDRMGKIQ